MKFDQNKSLVNEKLASSSKKKVEIGTQPDGSLRGSLKHRNERQTLRVLAKKSDTLPSSKDSSMPTQEEDRFERTLENESRSNLAAAEIGTGNQKRRARLSEKDERRLMSEHWSGKRGHELTYLGIFLFTLTLYFRPYELIPGLSSFQSLALILAVVTLLIYLPSQLSLEGKLTAFPVEIKCALFLIFWALLTLPLAKDPGLAWAQLKD